MRALSSPMVHGSSSGPWGHVGIVPRPRSERCPCPPAQSRREINDYYWNFKVETSLIELRNMIQVADLVVECALQRRESRGLHYTLDFPSEMPDSHPTSVRRV